MALPGLLKWPDANNIKQVRDFNIFQLIVGKTLIIFQHSLLKGGSRIVIRRGCTFTNVQTNF